MTNLLKLCAALVATLALASPALAGPDVPTVPGDIAVGDGYKPFLVGHATGVQIYTCTALPSGAAWGPATPRADLYDDNGKLIVQHFAGPSWQAKDGSMVVARRAKSVSVDQHALPWLLLETVSATAGPDGDRLAGTTHIERIATVGGLPPAPEQCDQDAVGTVREVPYTADYVFWKRS